MTKYINVSEPTLIHLLKLGDREAYQELYNREVNLLMVYTYKLLTDWHEVEITVADALTKLWHNRDVFDEGVPLARQLKSLIDPKILVLINEKCDKRDKHLSHLDQYMKQCEAGTIKMSNHEN